MVDLVKTSMAHLWANQGDIVSPTDEKIEEGWGIEPVPRQWWNWMQNRVDNNVAYLLQKGIPEWDATTEYIVNRSYVQRQDVVFKCIQTNTGKDPLSNPESWIKAFASASAALEAIGALTPQENTFPYFTGTNIAALTALTPLARTFLANSTAAQMRATISAQQESNILSALANVASGINALPYFTGQAQANTTILTAFARSLLDDDTAPTARTTLGLGSIATQDSTSVSITGGNISGINPIAVASGGTGSSTVVGARTNLGLGNAATRDVTTGASDGTVGRVMLTGYGGLGTTGIAIPNAADLDTYTLAGFYGQTSNAYATTGSNYPVPLAGSLLVEAAGGSITTQTYTVYSSGEKYQRTRYAATWYPWRKVFDSGNVSTFIQTLLTAADAAATRAAIGANDASNLTTGTVPIARGGTGATAKTGSGRNVLDTSPEFLGTPTAPTAPSGTKTQQIATTAFVIDNASANPIGTVIQSASASVPSGYLKCNGANVSRTTYSALFNQIGTRFGAGDGSTTFTLPDLRGEFIRGWDDGRGVDSGRTLGSWQGGQNQAHAHSTSTSYAGNHTHTGIAQVAGNHNHSIASNRDDSSGNNWVEDAAGTREARSMYTGYAGNHTHTLDINANGNHNHVVTVNVEGGEARPRNIALMYCIKF